MVYFRLSPPVVLLAIILSLSSRPARANPGVAETRYVNIASPDDGGNGTTSGIAGPNRAKKTVQAGLNLMDGPGDKLIIMPGTYPFYNVDANGDKVVKGTVSSSSPKSFLRNLSGTQAQPMAIVAKYPRTVVFEGDDALEANTQNLLEIGATSPVQPVNWLTIEGIDFIRSGGTGIKIFSSNHITIRNCYFKGCNKSGVLTAYSSYITIESCDSSYNLQEHNYYFSNSGDYNVLRNSIGHHSAANAMQINADASMIDPSQGKNGDGLAEFCQVIGNTFYENGGGTSNLGISSPYFPPVIWSADPGTWTYSATSSTIETGAISSVSTQVAFAASEFSTPGQTITVNSANWMPNEQSANHRVLKVMKGGNVQYRPIASNTVNSITVAYGYDAVPDNTWDYAIVTLPRVTDPTKGWIPGHEAQYPRTFSISAGKGVGGLRAIFLNDATSLWFETPFTTAPDNTSAYQILHAPNNSRGDGVTFNLLSVRSARIENNVAYNERHKLLVLSVNGDHKIYGGTGGITKIDSFTIDWAAPPWGTDDLASRYRTLTLGSGGSYTIVSNTANRITVDRTITQTISAGTVWKINEPDDLDYYSGDNHIEHNTILVDKGGVFCNKGAKRNTFKYNIFSCSQAVSGVFGWDQGGPPGGTDFAVGNNVSDYNWIVNAAGNVIGGYTGASGTVYNMANWRSVKGMDIHGNNALPVFKRPNAEPYDFHPVPGSPVLDNGNGIYIGAYRRSD